MKIEKTNSISQISIKKEIKWGVPFMAVSFLNFDERDWEKNYKKIFSPNQTQQREASHWNIEKRMFKNLARSLNTLRFVEFTSSIYLNTDGLFLKYLVKNSSLASLKTGLNIT